MDPLCQTQSLAYLRRLAAGGHRFALVTFEQPRYRLDSKQRAAMKESLAQEGIKWYPLKYHKRFPLIATGYDVLRAILLGVWLRLRHRPQVVHSRSSIPAAMALVIARLCGLKFLYDADAKLSEEYADNGHWSRASLAYRIVSRVEAEARRRCDSIVVLSNRLRDDFESERETDAPIKVIPCCVDVESFRFSDEARRARRRELGVGDEKLFVYVGKTGPRYLVDEIFEFFKVAKREIGAARLLIVSADKAEAFDRAAARHAVAREDYCVQYAPREKVFELLSASDAGLAFIRSAACERGSSPVKIGEYLATGLPVVMTAQIGDYSDLIADKRLGVIVNNHSIEEYVECAKRLEALWSEGEQLKERCRAAALEAVSLESVGAMRYEAIYRSLLGEAQG